MPSHLAGITKSQIPKSLTFNGFEQALLWVFNDSSGFESHLALVTHAGPLSVDHPPLSRTQPQSQQLSTMTLLDYLRMDTDQVKVSTCLRGEQPVAPMAFDMSDF
jgi:hypothetical protein